METLKNETPIEDQGIEPVIEPTVSATLEDQSSETVDVAANDFTDEQWAHWEKRVGDCQTNAKDFLYLQQRSNAALWKALATAYVLWRELGGDEANAYRAMLDKHGVTWKDVKRKFSMLVKLVFSLDTSKGDAKEKARTSKQVYRLATALDKIHSEFKKFAWDFNDVEVVAKYDAKVVQFIENSGGVEDLQYAQLNDEGLGGDGTDTSGANDDPLSENETYFLTKDKLAEFSLDDLAGGQGTLVPIVGRVAKDGIIEVVSVLSRKDDVVKYLLEKADDYDLSNAPVELNLLAEITSLAEAIEEHDSSEPQHKGDDPNAKTTKFKRSSRMVVFRHGRPEGQILVGLNRSVSSVVLHVDPKVDVKLPVFWGVYLDTKSRRKFEREFRQPSLRGRFTCQVVRSPKNEKSAVMFMVTDKRTNSATKLFIRDYKDHACEFLDVDDRIANWQFDITITADEFRRLYDDYLVKYAKLSKSKTRAKVLDLRVASDGLFLNHHESEEVPFDFETGLSEDEAYSFCLLGRDLANVAAKLVEVGVLGSVTIQGDQTGVVKIAAETELVRCAFFVPTVLDNGEDRNPKHFMSYPNTNGTEASD